MPYRRGLEGEGFVDGGGGEVVEEIADAGGEEGHEGMAFFGGGGGGVADAGVGGDQVPGAGEGDPFFADGFEAAGFDGAFAGLIHFDELGEEGEGEGGFDFVGVFGGFFEHFGVLVGADFVPVAEEEEDVGAVVEFSHEGFEFVAAVAVEEEEFADALAFEGIDEVGEDFEEGGGGDGEGDGGGDLELIGVDAEGDGGEEEDFCAAGVGVVAGAAGDFIDLEGVGAVGQVEVVGFGGAEGENGGVPFMLADEVVGLLGEDEVVHGGE